MESHLKREINDRAESLLDVIDFKNILFKIIHHKWLILSITSCSFLVGIFYVINISPKYVSSTLIQVDNQLGSANSMQQMLGNMSTAFASPGQASPADIEIALIKSRFILQSVIDKLHLNISVSPHYFPFFGERFARFRTGDELQKPFLGLSHFAWGGEELELEQFEMDPQFLYQGTKFLLKVDSTSEYRLFTKDGHFILKGEVGKRAKSSLENYPSVTLLIRNIKANSGARFDINIRNSEDILKQISQGLSIIDLGNAYKTKTGVLQLSYQGKDPNLIPQILNTIVDYAIQRNVEKKSAEASKTLDFLNRQLPHVRKSLENAETDLNEYRVKSGTIDISQEGRIILMQLSAIEQNIAELKLKKVEMLQELTPKHPFIMALNEKQSQLQKEIMSLESKIKTLPITDQRALSLERDVKVKNQLYLLLLNKIQQLQVLKAGTLSDIRTLYQATVPIMPLPTHKYFKLIVSIIAGFLLSVMVVFVRDLFKHGISDTELVEARLGIPTFAIIPCSAKQHRFNSKLRLKSKTHLSYVLAQKEPKDLAIEGIRSLRTILQFTLSQSKNNIISVLGASPNIGKSFISINLSQVLVDSGKKVLLVDCDLRKGKLHDYLGGVKSPGFADVLTNSCLINEAIYHLENGFDYIPAGNYPQNPSELLMGQQLKNLLEKFSLHYDIVIIDTPPILAVTDAIIIAKNAGLNLMVIGSSTDQVEELELMVKRVRRNGIDIQGLVFNNKSQTEATMGQYRYYYAYENQ